MRQRQMLKKSICHGKRDEVAMAIDLLGPPRALSRCRAGGRGLAAGWPHRSWSRRTVAGLLVVLVALSAVGSAMAVAVSSMSGVRNMVSGVGRQETE